eukprot:3748170-Rhodomonas_salina.4
MDKPVSNSGWFEAKLRGPTLRPIGATPGVQNPSALHASMSGKLAQCPADDDRHRKTAPGPAANESWARNSYSRLWSNGFCVAEECN